MKWIIEDFTMHVLVSPGRRYAIIRPTYFFGDGSQAVDAQYRAHIGRTGEAAVFPTLQQAKDWAQAVAILNH
jgi:hypothetical protein